MAISDIDTRELTRKLRSGGVMRGVVATGRGTAALIGASFTAEPIVARMKPARPDQVSRVICPRFREARAGTTLHRALRGPRFAV